MPWMAVFRAETFDLALHDEFRKKAPFSMAPPEALAHAFGQGKAGHCAVDVWDDEGAMMDFLENVVKPGLQSVGLPYNAPDIYQLTEFVVTDRACRDHRIEAAAASPA